MKLSKSKTKDLNKICSELITHYVIEKTINSKLPSRKQALYDIKCSSFNFIISCSKMLDYSADTIMAYMNVMTINAEEKIDDALAEIEMEIFYNKKNKNKEYENSLKKINETLSRLFKP